MVKRTGAKSTAKISKKESKRSKSRGDDEAGEPSRFLSQGEIKKQIRKIKDKQPKRQATYELGKNDSSDEDIVGSIPARNPLM